MKKSKRGRPKGSFKDDGLTNGIFWKGMLRDNKVQQFINRGSVQQKTTIKNVLKYLKNMEPRFFEKVNGNELLKQLKGEIK